jgi:RimJ/RimL family protein N-acetyltransferase
MTSPLLPIETDRLILRTFNRNDIDAVADYHTLPDVQRYLDWKARDRVELTAAINSMRKQTAINRPGDTMSLAVERKSDGKLIGHVALRWYDATAAQAELRYVFNPIYRRQGYATEAVKAALNLGFDVFSFHRIFGRCDARNTASARLMRGLGMRLEAHYREHALFQGEWDEELHFAILDREWSRSPKVKELAANRVA